MNRRNLRLDCFLLLSIAILSIIEFSAFFSSGSFGSEFTFFFDFSYNRSPGEVLRSYLQFNRGWYRPTQFFLPYWVGEKFLSWHNPDGWRAYEFFTMLVVCGLIYWFVLVLLPGRRIAAFAAALYFTCVPTIYAAVYEIAAFDFFHIIFSVLSVIAFTIGYRLRTWRAVGWTTLALLSYVAALTSKEVTIVIPVYLTILSGILFLYEPGLGETKDRVLREIKRLAPFWVMTAVYWMVHMRQIPRGAFTGSNAYRLSPNWMLILRNAGTYPLWFARIYGYVPDPDNQAAGYRNLRNDVIGTVALVLVCYISFRLWRTGPEYRKYLLLAVAWVAIFLMVPIYSGGYFWHGNLALCGYCMLFGVALDWLAARIHGRAARFAFLALLIAGMVGLTRTDAAECLISGIHSETFRINSTVLSRPPVPVDRFPRSALVYVEDRKSLGGWFFGAGSLFNVVYLDRDLHQVTVPALNEVSRGDCARWLKYPHSFFFRYDDSYRWIDATEEFRAFAIKKVSEQMLQPKITGVSPAETRAGMDFNVTGNGLSAMGVRGSNFKPGAEILINGQKQPTVYGKDFISATVPREAYSRPGNMSVQVRNPDGSDSEPYLFRILK